MTSVQIALYAASIYNLVLAFIILWKTHMRKAGANFAWFLVCNAAWTGCVATAQYHLSWDILLVLVRLTFVVGVFIAISGIWFCAEFPQLSPRFRTVALVMSLLGLPWLAFAWTDYIIPPNLRFGALGLEADVGPLVLPFIIWIGVCITLSLAHLAYKAQRLRGLQRLQVRYILLGILGLALSLIPNLILPALTQSSRYAPLGPLACLFVTTTTTYAIVRYRLMDIKIVLRAGLVYSVTIGMLSLLFALLVPTLNSALTEYIHLPATTGSFIMAFLIALAFQPLRRYVQYHVDRRFFKSVYDYRLTLREAGSALASVRDRELLVATLVNALARTLRPRSITVYLPGHDDVLTKVSSSEQTGDLPHTISETEPVLAHAIEMDEVLLSEELLRQSGPQESIGKQMKDWGVDVAIPLIAGNRLCGVVFLGEKLSGDVYTADDIGLLRILGKQAAIALDNARHFDDMVLMNEYHERLLQIMQDGMIALDPQERVITFNPMAERITGVASADAIGRSLDDLHLSQLLPRGMDGQAMETTLLTPAGVEIPVLVTVTPFLRRWEVANSRLVVFRDLSTLRALEQDKMQAERFSSMGAMAASLAHEIKNPLVPIQMFAHLLPLRYDDDEFRKEFSHTVVNEVERINRLVGQMLDLVRKPSHDRAPVDLREVLDRLLLIVRPECERHNIRIHLECDHDLPQVVGVAGQLYQALLNVLMNAIQAMQDGGDLTIEMHGTKTECICRISDTGPGVSEEELSRIFEPLFTTKVGGHGLGLALTYQFIRSHGGEIRAENIPGAGLAVVLVLPACRQAEAELLCS